jgi:hypothetical protein
MDLPDFIKDGLEFFRSHAADSFSVDLKRAQGA